MGVDKALYTTVHNYESKQSCNTIIILGFASCDQPTFLFQYLLLYDSCINDYISSLLDIGCCLERSFLAMPTLAI